MLQLFVSFLISFSFLLDLLSFLYEISFLPSIGIDGRNRKSWKREKEHLRVGVWLCAFLLCNILIIVLLLL